MSFFFAARPDESSYEEDFTSISLSTVEYELSLVTLETASVLGSMDCGTCREAALR
jgi:hypothetical protein